jgi:nitroimidazol reductase NimA-like FMN-containing flavoprotein (pyridoxamine 5'-phosphate oxidase superfamily)
MPEQKAAVRIRDLTSREAELILARNHVGRLAFIRSNRLTITPVHYVYEGGWLYGRTSAGQKIADLSANAYNWWPVVFEVDEVEGLFSWRSVVVHGGFSVVEANASAARRIEWQHAIELLRMLLPTTLTPDDPVPDRTIIFRISASDTTGREAVG